MPCHRSIYTFVLDTTFLYAATCCYLKYDKYKRWFFNKKGNARNPILTMLHHQTNAP